MHAISSLVGECSSEPCLRFLTLHVGGGKQIASRLWSCLQSDYGPLAVQGQRASCIAACSKAARPHLYCSSWMSRPSSSSSVLSSAGGPAHGATPHLKSIMCDSDQVRWSLGVQQAAAADSQPCKLGMKLMRKIQAHTLICSIEMSTTLLHRVHGLSGHKLTSAIRLVALHGSCPASALQSCLCVRGCLPLGAAAASCARASSASLPHLRILSFSTLAVSCRSRMALCSSTSTPLMMPTCSKGT